MSAQEHGLGRRFAPDERDKLYQMRALVAEAPPTRTYRYYRTGHTLDQGNTGTCVGHAGRGWLDAGPVMVKDGPSPFGLYRAAILVDEWADNDGEGTLPDADLQAGTSVRALCKVLQAQGYIRSYHWAASAQDVADYLLGDTGSTVILGTVWLRCMFAPDRAGIVRVYPGSQVEGGHSYLATGYNQRLGQFRCRTSWGADWGRAGDFFLAGEDLETLLSWDGEAASPVEVRVR